jgi:hypothetical protein
MPKLSFKPKQVTKKILSPLQDRAYDVLVNRFGLGDTDERKTLEAIGDTYGITRERVRQIESAALAAIRKSEDYKNEQPVFAELKEIITRLGSLVSEDELLDTIAKDKTTQNHIHFYLVLGDEFNKHKEDDHFSSRWNVDQALSDLVHTAIKKLYEGFSDDELVPEADMISRFLNQLKDISEEYRNEEIARRWLNLSKKLSRNPLGEWGKTEASGVKTRGIKDFAYLVMRKHGSPMHFREVAKAIESTFGKKNTCCYLS